MTLAMDIRLASEKAKIGFVFGKIGIVPEACSSWFLPRIVGISQALEWTYTADIFDAAEAERGGLVRSVHAPDQLLPEAYKLAHRIADNRSPVSIALTRQMLYRNSAQPHPLEAHRVDSLAMFYTSLGDGKEGVQSFLEKRAPKFEGLASAMPPFYPWWE
jgi:enoyl-CoA hydratase/carnithine racemase